MVMLANGQNSKYSYTDFSRLFVIFLQLRLIAAAGSLACKQVEHAISKDGGKKQQIPPLLHCPPPWLHGPMAFFFRSLNM